MYARSESNPTHATALMRLLLLLLLATAAAAAAAALAAMSVVASAIVIFSTIVTNIIFAWLQFPLLYSLHCVHES